MSSKRVTLLSHPLLEATSKGDIGSMAAPERVNVLLSRARDVLIIVGNSETFLSSRTGQKMPEPTFEPAEVDRAHLRWIASPM